MNTSKIKTRKKIFKLLEKPETQNLHQCKPASGKYTAKVDILRYYKETNVTHSWILRCQKCNRLFKNLQEKLTPMEIEKIAWTAMVDKNYMKEKDVERYRKLLIKDNQ